MYGFINVGVVPEHWHKRNGMAGDRSNAHFPRRLDLRRRRVASHLGTEVTLRILRSGVVRGPGSSAGRGLLPSKGGGFRKIIIIIIITYQLIE